MFRFGKVQLISVHFLCWMLYTLFFHLIAAAYAQNGNVPWYNTAVKLFFAAYVFYTSAYFIFPFCLRQKKRFYHLIYFIPISIAVNFCLRYFVIGTLLPYLAGTAKPPDTLYQFFIFGLNWWIQFTLYGLAYYLVFRAITTERKLRQTETAILAAENRVLQSDKEKAEAQYNYLKSQINPHFLYNTLNFFYAGTRTTNPRLAGGIMKLAQIMHYSLDGGDEQGQVPLDKEWEQVNNYIDLQQMRSSPPLQVVVQQLGPLEGITLPPHLLLTIIENAFKHGHLHQPGNPLHIQLDTSSGQMRFTVTNKIKNNKKQPGGGVGQQYIQKRIAKEYKNEAVFEYGPAASGEYRVHLVLPAAPVATPV
jgi:two-component system, LytTR family, sensor kinase